MIRLWTMGNLEHKILPTREAVNRFKKILEDIDKCDIKDIVWGPELTVTVVDYAPKELVFRLVETKDGEKVFAIDNLEDLE